MDSLNVRAAMPREVLEILSADGVSERIQADFSGGVVNGSPYLINNRMLLVVLPIDYQSVEAHLASPKLHWKHIHTDIEISLKFIQKIGYNYVYTNVSEHLKTTLNLLKKHGFEQVDQHDNEVILEWASKQR